MAPSKVRALGWLLVVLGIALSGSMAWLAHWLQQVISGAAVGSRWNGTPEFTRATFGLFYSVMAFGLVALAGGIVQVVTGQRSRAVAIFVVLTLIPMAFFIHRIFELQPGQ